MKYLAKVLAAAVFSTSLVSNAAITRDDIEWATVVGWDLAGELRACNTYYSSGNFLSSSAYVEIAILKLVRRSKIVDDDFPEIQAAKIALMHQVNASALAGKERLESKDAVISSCRSRVAESKSFIKKADMIGSGYAKQAPASTTRKKMPMVPSVCAAMARGEGYSVDCDNALRRQINEMND